RGGPPLTGATLPASFSPLSVLISVPQERRSGLGYKGSRSATSPRSQNLYTVFTESSCCVLHIRHRIGRCLSGWFQIFSRRTHSAEGFFQSSGGVQNEHAKARGANNKCVRLELGKEDGFTRFHSKDLFCHIYVELSFEDVEEFILARVYMRRRFISRH